MVLVGGVGGLVIVPGWWEHSPVAGAAKNVGWDGRVLAGMSSCWCWWGVAFPRGCGSFACKMCGVGAAWLSSAAQGAGKLSRPGTRAFLESK